MPAFLIKNCWEGQCTEFIRCFPSILTRGLLLTGLIEIWLTPWLGHICVVGTKEGKQQVVSMFGVHEDKVRVIPFPTPVLPTSGNVFCEQKSAFEAPIFSIRRTNLAAQNHVVILAAMKILQDKSNINYVAFFPEQMKVISNTYYSMRKTSVLGIRSNMWE